MNIRKSLLKVFSANALQLISNLIIGFVVPVVMNIEEYANLKTYMLFISYVGLLHFGFPDGLFIKYGGKRINDVNKEELKGEHNFFVIFQLVVSSIFFIISIISKNIIVFLFSISILPIMLQCFHKNIAQATGDFNKYSKIMYIYTISYLVMNVILALIMKEHNYVLYCLTTFVSNLVSVLFFEYKFFHNYKNYTSLYDKKQIKNTIKKGFFIMLGNLIVLGLFSIDKWFVKLFYSTEDFAYYSFAVSMINIVNTLVGAISITFYNYLCLNNNAKNINVLKKLLITFGGLASACYFPLSIIVNVFINKYVPSLKIIAITFAVFPYMILVNALYLNLYKVNKDEKKYLKVVIFIFIISIVLNVLATIAIKNTTSIAFATLITIIIWVIYSTIDLKKVLVEKKMFYYLFALTIVFIICTRYLNYYSGFLIYCIIYFILSYIFDKNFFIELKNMILNIMKKVKKNNEKN